MNIVSTWGLIFDFVKTPRADQVNLLLGAGNFGKI
jgi:hypothetical protein